MTARRTDANQAEIVKAMRVMGALVVDLHAVGKGVPDLLVCWKGRNILIEVKTVNGRMTKPEEDFFSWWTGPLAIVRTPEDAYQVLRNSEEEELEI